MSYQQVGSPQTYPQQQGYATQSYPQQQGYTPQPQGYVVQPVISHGGGCPQCHHGVMSDEFTCCGIVCAILFFPIGLVCCFLMTDKRCGSCGYVLTT